MMQSQRICEAYSSNRSGAKQAVAGMGEALYPPPLRPPLCIGL